MRGLQNPSTYKTVTTSITKVSTTPVRKQERETAALENNGLSKLMFQN